MSLLHLGRRGEQDWFDAFSLVYGQGKSPHLYAASGIGGIPASQDDFVRYKDPERRISRVKTATGKWSCLSKINRLEGKLS